MHSNSIPRHERNLRAREQAIRFFVPELVDSAVSIDGPRLAVVEAYDWPRAVSVFLREEMDLILAVLRVCASDRGAFRAGNGGGPRFKVLVLGLRLGLGFAIVDLVCFLAGSCSRHEFGVVELEFHDFALGAVHEARGWVEVLL